MTADEIEHTLLKAEARGFLTICEPFDPECPHLANILDSWNSICHERGRHRVLVLNTGWGLWRTAVAFHAGPDAEMVSVRHEIDDAFHRHFGSGPRKEGEVWFASTQNRRHAEALAFELSAIDAEPRDPNFEEVFVVHER